MPPSTILKLPAVDLFTDGSCRGKKGKGHGGWAFILRHRSTGVEKVHSGGVARTTSERIEIEAIIQGLSALKRRSHVTIHCDNIHVMNAIRDFLPEWKRFGWCHEPGGKRPVKNRDLWQTLDPMLAKHEVTAKWVKGHAGHPDNVRCDKLSAKAAKAIMDALENGMLNLEESLTAPASTPTPAPARLPGRAPAPSASAPDQLPEIDLFTDGACIGNPGPGGWAFILRHRASGKEKVQSGGLRNTTNNRMEILAVLEGLAALKRPSRVTLHSDSQYVINGLRDWLPKWKRCGWKRSKGSKIAIKNADLWQRADAFLAQHELSYTWVRGHAGHPENERCDVLSVQAADKAAKDPSAPADVRPELGNRLFAADGE